MASRSFKPASYLASAAQQAAQQPSRSPRPSFTRSSSSSSAVSTKSEDSFTATLRSLSTIDREREGNNTSAPRQIIEDTPGRKRSQPIAIELPPRTTAVYTPLSARGDLPGGYFPNHEDIDRTYKPHPFSSHHEHRNQATSNPSSPTTFTMSASSSTLPSPSHDTTPKPPPSILSPAFHAAVPIPESMGLMMPLGKYHPSNYKSPSTSTAVTPTAPSINAPPTTNLAIPTAIQSERKRNKPKHERRTSDVKRKLQQYQRDMIAQARLASVPKSGTASGSTEPDSPRLLPAGSPGPITPFELEEGDGYLGAGSSRSLVGRGVDREGENELVGRMIMAEEERRRMEGNTPPAARV